MLKLDVGFDAQFCHREHFLDYFESPFYFLLEFIFVLLSCSSSLRQ